MTCVSHIAYAKVTAWCSSAAVLHLCSQRHWRHLDVEFQELLLPPGVDNCYMRVKEELCSLPPDLEEGLFTKSPMVRNS